MSETKLVWADCPICGARIEVEVDVKTLKAAPYYPISVVNVHGRPSHLTVLFVDAEFQVRGVEGHKVLVTEEVSQDPLFLGREERKAAGRMVDAPELVEGLKMVRGVEFVDSKGVAIVSLSEAGPTTGNLFSPSGRLKSRFVVNSQEAKQQLQPRLSDALRVLDELTPLSPMTLRLLLKVIEESVQLEESLDSAIIKHVAQSSILIPCVTVKPMMFDAMRSYVLTDNFAVQEIDMARGKMDGYSTLLNLMRIIEQSGLSLVRLVQALELLRKAEAIRLEARVEAVR